VGCFADPEFPAPSFSIWEEGLHSWLGLPTSIERFQQGVGDATRAAVVMPPSTGGWHLNAGNRPYWLAAISRVARTGSLNVLHNAQRFSARGRQWSDSHAWLTPTCSATSATD